MRSVLSTVGALVFALALVGPGPAQAKVSPPSAEGVTELGSFTLSTQPIALDAVKPCINPSMALTLDTNAEGVSWTVSFDVDPGNGVTPWVGFAQGAGPAAQQVGYLYCQGSFRPTSKVTGNVTFRIFDGTTPFEVESNYSFTVAVKRAPTKTDIGRIVRDQPGPIRVEGRVTANSQGLSRVGVEGPVSLFMRGAKGRWVRIGTGNADARGQFVIFPSKVVPSTAVWRVDYGGADRTAPSSSSPKRG